MEEKTIIRVNGVDIVATSDGLIPIRPICEALGIDYSRQLKKVKESEDFGSVVGVTPTTGADGKQYEMVCLPIEFIYGWLFTINPDNVKEEAREKVRRYRMECYHALYLYFHRPMERVDEQNRLERESLHIIDRATAQIDELKKLVAGERRKLEKIRQERLTNEPQLFD